MTCLRRLCRALLERIRERILARLARRWPVQVQRYRCRRGEHRETVVDVYGELRLVCIDCPRARTLGRVRPNATNKIHNHFPWERPR